MRFVGRGHPAVRATHDKTWELSPDPGITERATCILAVDVTVDDARPLAGPVRLTLTAGGLAWSVDAVANPGWDPSGPAVVRRSPVRTPGTFATEATGTAADLPRALATLLGDPSVPVEVTVEPLPSGPTVVLVSPGATPGAALVAELTAADVVVAEDPVAARLLGERVGSGPVPVRGRVVVVAAEELPGRSVAERPPGTRVETLDLPPAMAAAAALPGWGPVLMVPADADARAALAHAPAGARTVLTTRADRVPQLLTLATEVLGEHRAAVSFTDRPPLLLTGGEAPAGRDRVWLAVAAGSPRVDPAALAMARGLLADGVPTKTVARALAALTGEPQRRAYETVLGLRSN